MSTILEVSSTEFETQVLTNERLVVVDFSAVWCGPCKRLLPELEAVAAEYAGKATFVKVDIDQSPDLAIKYGVQGVPNMTFLRDGEVVDVAVGLMPRSEISARVKRNLETPAAKAAL